MTEEDFYSHLLALYPWSLMFYVYVDYVETWKYLSKVKDGSPVLPPFSSLKI